MGLLVNVVWLVVVLISMLMRYPLVGVIVAAVTGCGMDWRKQPGERRRRYYLATWLLAGMFSLRLIVEVPSTWRVPAPVTALSHCPPGFGDAAIFARCLADLASGSRDRSHQ